MAFTHLKENLLWVQQTIQGSLTRLSNPRPMFGYRGFAAGVAAASQV
jgi:hypothetical protein